MVKSTYLTYSSAVIFHLYSYIQFHIEQVRKYKSNIYNLTKGTCIKILGDPEVSANIYGKSGNLPNTDTENYSTDLRGNVWVTQHIQNVRAYTYTTGKNSDRKTTRQRDTDKQTKVYTGG